MKFLYRGAQYETEPLTLEVTEGETGGIYRGSRWKTHQPKRHYRRRQQSFEFTYRGAHYRH